MVIKEELKRLSGCVVRATALFDAGRWRLGGRGSKRGEDVLREDGDGRSKEKP